MREVLDDLEKRIGETARSRFIASTRLGKRDQRISWIVAMASTYGIVLTVIPYFVRISLDVVDIFNLVTVGLSIVTLVSSLLIGSRRDAVNAEQHHRSALELNELKRELMLLKSLSDEGRLDASSCKSMVERYNNILQKYSINHEPEDYARLQLERSHDYPWLKRPSRVWMRCKILISSSVSMLVMVALTLFVGWLVFGHALPSRLPRLPS